MLARIYPTEYAASPAQQNVSSITFAGTVFGTLVFGVSSRALSKPVQRSLIVLSTSQIIGLASGHYLFVPSACSSSLH